MPANNPDSMQESHAPAASPIDFKRGPLHEEIAQCARDLWAKSGKPDDRDVEIWLEAEQRLLSVTKSPGGKNSGPISPFEPPPEKSGIKTRQRPRLKG
jgi:hypothetical protein